ncbi:hypothetical protein IFVP203_C1120073 [Vibrio parahaemolyticus]
MPLQELLQYCPEALIAIWGP